MSDSTPKLDRRELLLTTAGAAAALLTGAGAAQAAAAAPLNLGHGQIFDGDWRFRRGAGEGQEATAFDDGGWRAVDLPHDWSIEDLPPDPVDARRIVGPFDPKAEGDTATGYTVGGEGWYRKHFTLRAPPGGHVEILFDGVYAESDVWLNGQHLGAHASGYTPVAYDLTPHLAANGANVLAVRVRNLGRNSRWYSGSGIYRHVWLDVWPERARIARWGVVVSTRRVTAAGAEIEISTGLMAAGPELSLSWMLRDHAGRKIAELTRAATDVRGAGFTIASPDLWSPESPRLYTLATELRRGQTVLDRRVTPFGIRIVSFDAEHGMRINGVSAKLRGGCIHHDNGLLGAAAFDAAEERKVQLLRARGFNAVRPSHNLYSPGFLDACDRHGMLVIGETFDAWRQSKLPRDYAVYFATDWRADLAAIVQSTRNHPSIIMWSIGNEIPERNLPDGMQTQWQLANEVHSHDPTRPVTAAVNGYPGRPVIAAAGTARAGVAGVEDRAGSVFLDVVGYNYKLMDYEHDHQKYPQRVYFGTESFPNEMAAIWELTGRTPWLLGDFVWTAMDYLGEAGIGGSMLQSTGAMSAVAMGSGWPWVNAFCGDIDLIGQQKAPSFARDVAWGLSPLEVLVQRPVPEGKAEMPRQWGWRDEKRSWSWPGAEGKPLSVSIYTAGDRVELLLNGRKLSDKKVTAADLGRVEFSAPYEPGMLEAVAYRGGAELARRRLSTVGKPAALRITLERATASAARAAVSFALIEIVDAKAQVVPDAAQRIELAIAGPAELLGFGSANPLATSSFQAPAAQSWDGRALAILRGKARTGTVSIEARSAGLKSGTASLRLV